MPLTTLDVHENVNVEKLLKKQKLRDLTVFLTVRDFACLKTTHEIKQLRLQDMMEWE